MPSRTGGSRTARSQETTPEAPETVTVADAPAAPVAGVAPVARAPKPAANAGDHPFKAIVDQLADGVYLVEPDRTIKYWSPGAERISGHSAGDVVGRSCFDNILDHVDARGRSLCHTSCPLAATMRDGKDREATIWLRHGDGHRKPVRVRATPLRDEAGRVVGGIEYFSDATATMAAAKEVDRAKQEALTDPLTGLPNRRMFDAALRGRLENLARYGWPFGLLIVDIDHFKEINDLHGHALGDAALAGIAATLTGAVRSGDVLARWGGEEFAVLVEASDEDGLRDAGERMRLLVERSEVRFEGLVVTITVSVGGALAVFADTPEAAFARADGALYAAKNAGRNRTEIVS